TTPFPLSLHDALPIYTIDLECMTDRVGPDRTEVEQILAEYFHDPEENWNEEKHRYELSWETEYDEYGECLNDIVEELRPQLPPRSEEHTSELQSRENL